MFLFSEVLNYSYEKKNYLNNLPLELTHKILLYSFIYSLNDVNYSFQNLLLVNKNTKNIVLSGQFINILANVITKKNPKLIIDKYKNFSSIYYFITNKIITIKHHLDNDEFTSEKLYIEGKPKSIQFLNIPKSDFYKNNIINFENDIYKLEISFEFAHYSYNQIRLTLTIMSHKTYHSKKTIHVFTIREKNYIPEYIINIKGMVKVQKKPYFVF